MEEGNLAHGYESYVTEDERREPIDAVLDALIHLQSSTGKKKIEKADLVWILQMSIDVIYFKSMGLISPL